VYTETSSLPDFITFHSVVENGELTKMTTGKLNNGLPQVPPRRCPSGVSVPPLPVLSAAAEIVHTVANNQVVLVSGETGCGKTTQVGQLFSAWKFKLMKCLIWIGELMLVCRVYSAATLCLNTKSVLLLLTQYCISFHLDITLH